MTEKESQKSSTRRTTTKRKRAEDDDGDDDDDEERPRSMRLGEIVDRLETYTERAEALDKKLEERRVAEKEWRLKMMELLEVSNSYAEESCLALLLTNTRPMSTGHCAQYR